MYTGNRTYVRSMTVKIAKETSSEIVKPHNSFANVQLYLEPNRQYLALPQDSSSDLVKLPKELLPVHTELE